MAIPSATVVLIYDDVALTWTSVAFANSDPTGRLLSGQATFNGTTTTRAIAPGQSSVIVINQPFTFVTGRDGTLSGMSCTAFGGWSFSFL